LFPLFHSASDSDIIRAHRFLSALRIIDIFWVFQSNKKRIDNFLDVLISEIWVEVKLNRDAFTRGLDTDILMGLVDDFRFGVK
jgi:hypothetical protein